MDVRRWSAYDRVLEPPCIILRDAVARGAQVETDALYRCVIHIEFIECPCFVFRHMYQSKRELVLVGADACSGVIRRIQNTVGCDEALGASRFKAAKVTGTAVLIEVEIAGSTRPEENHVL